MIVPGVLGMNVRGAMVHVAMDLVRANGREASGSRGSYGQSDQRERENQMSQGTKQAHGREANDASRPSQPYRPARLCNDAQSRSRLWGRRARSHSYMADPLGQHPRTVSREIGDGLR
jgi:hypothetical protein